MTRIMVTGHRQIPNETGVTATLRLVLQRMQLRDPGLVAVSGMALGTDMAFAEAAVDLGIPLIAAVPMAEQSNRWPSNQAARWRRILSNAEVVEVWRQPGYEASTFNAQFIQRNLWMLDNSNAMIAVWTGQEQGGTWHAVKEARRRNRQFLIVDPSTGALRTDKSRSVTETQTFPRWLVDPISGLKSSIGAYNLREIAPNLYVGAFVAPAFEVPFKWAAIFDFAGSSKEYLDDYPVPPVCLQFEDGDEIPPAFLEQVAQTLVQGHSPILLHCAMGLSRSASVAYAMLRYRHGLDHDTALHRIQVPGERGYPMPATLASARRWAESR